MAKGFTILFKKSPWDDENYSFFRMFKTEDGNIISEGNFYGRNIYSFKDVDIVTLSRTDIEEITRTTETFKATFRSNQQIIQIKKGIDKGVGFIGFNIGEDHLKENIGRKKISEEEFIAQLLYIFNLCTKNIAITGKTNPWTKKVEYYDKIIFDISKSKEVIEPSNVKVKEILTEGKPKSQETKSTTKVEGIKKDETRKTPNNAKNQQQNNVVRPINNEIVTPETENVKESEEKEQTQEASKEERKTIEEVIRKLKLRIIGQDKAIKDVVSTLFINQKVISSKDEDHITSTKANILIDGPTGTGKTMLVKQLSKIMELPMVITSVVSFSTTGYKGNDLQQILVKLLDEANGDIELAERGIICLDEFDKLGNNDSKETLVMRKALQEELLEYLSGGKFEIEYQGEKIEFDTSKITFIALGAFTNLRERKIAENEAKYKSSLGFGASIPPKDYIKKIEIDTKDYINEGIMRELVGRFTTKTYTAQLSVEDYKSILKDSLTSPLKTLEQIAIAYGKTIVCSEKIITYIAECVYKNDTGARGLQNIFNGIARNLLKRMMSEQEEHIELTSDMVDLVVNDKVRSYE